VRHSAATEGLLKKLVEAEVDGQSIADHAAGFADAIQRLREVSSSSNVVQCSSNQWREQDKSHKTKTKAKQVIHD